MMSRMLAQVRIAELDAEKERIAELQAEIVDLEAENARLLGTIKEEPVAFEYQHEETGVIGYIDQWQIDNGFFKNNPRLQLIGPLYRHPPVLDVSDE